MLDRIPPHVRDLEPPGEAANHPRDNVEPLALTELLALGEEQLVAEANAQKRPSFVEGGAERIKEPQRLEIAHGVVEGAVAGQDEGAGVLDHARVLRHDRAHAETAERVLDATQIPAPVVDDGNHATATPWC